MKKQTWSTWKVAGQTLYQVRRGSGGWYARLIQANHDSWPINEGEGEAKFAQARQLQKDTTPARPGIPSVPK